ncbi:hypothetical protein HY78_18700 [Rhizorhabdus wittichii DC-6]|nr:hypothetical protein HY78_18700 [Rhizorhabdus wittichii DC-6]
MATANNILYLTPFPAAELHKPMFEASSMLVNIRTILDMIQEVTDQAGEDVGKPASDEDWQRDRFDRVTRLTWIAIEELARVRDALDRDERAIIDHSELRRSVAAHQ